MNPRATKKTTEMTDEMQTELKVHDANTKLAQRKKKAIAILRILAQLDAAMEDYKPCKEKDELDPFLGYLHGDLVRIQDILVSDFDLCRWPMIGLLAAEVS